MKNFTRNMLIASFLTAVLLSSCSTAKYQYQAGNYEEAVAAASRKIRKNPKKGKQIAILEKAYRAAVDKELSRIRYLKLEGSPDNWVEIYERYSRIDRVVSSVKPLLPLYLKKELRYIDIEMIDIAAELAQAKLEAAQYMYADAERLLAAGNRYSAREAYYKFVDVRSMFGIFKDVHIKIEESYNKGQEFVMIAISNESHALIPKAAFDQIYNIPTSQFNSTWVKYKTTDDGSNFSKKVNVIIEYVNIGPEQIIEKNNHFEKDIQDGWTYQLDGNGNVVKDTLGNDIKLPVIRRVSADVLETELTKAGVISGSLGIYDLEKSQVIEFVPFSESFGFNHKFSKMRGDKRAVPEEALKNIGGNAVPFPADTDMLLSAFGQIKTNLLSFIDKTVKRYSEYVVSR